MSSGVSAMIYLPFLPLWNDVLAFLAAQFHAGHGYCYLNVYRSAISSIYPKIDGYEVGSHLLVCLLLKGVFNERPPLPKHQRIWSVESMIT